MKPLLNKGNSWGGRSASEIERDPRYSDAYSRWHWGVNPAQFSEWKDDSKDAQGRGIYPDALIECGRLVELSFRIPGARRDMAMRLEKDQSNRSHLTFDPDHPHERLYVLLPPDVLRESKQAYWKKNPQDPMDMNHLARFVGGRHGKMSDYPQLAVKPVGILTSFVYACEKKGDGFSMYVHRLGEESGIRPVLAADDQGRLWVVGGNYTSPTPGVTD